VADNESLARIGTTSFLQLIINTGKKADVEKWTLLCKSFYHVITKTIPINEIQELMNAETPQEASLMTKKIKSKCAVLLILIDALNDTTSSFYDQYNLDHLDILTNTLRESISFTNSVNDSASIQEKLNITGLDED
jgi:hypothetical protein